MTFAEFRIAQGWTLAEFCVALGLSPSSKGWLSEIENGRRDASVLVAVKVEKLSGGEVLASSLCAALRGGDQAHEAAPNGDAPSVAPPVASGAGAKSGALQ